MTDPHDTDRRYADARLPARRGVPTWAVVVIAASTMLVGVLAGYGVGLMQGANFAELFSFDGPEGVDVRVEAPTRVGSGTEFDVAVTVSNTSESQQELHSIDLYDSYLDGFRIVSIRPEPDRREDIFNCASFYFEQPIEPGDSTSVVFNLEADRTGVFSGDLDVCINNEWDFVTNYLETSVTP